MLQGKIFVAGHRGMVGRAVVRRLRQMPRVTLLTQGRDQLDLTDAAEVDGFFANHAPQTVIFAAAKVGGIHANMTYPVEFMTENLLMAVNTLKAAHRNGVQRFLFLGSTCIYPRNAPQPIREQALLSDYLESTNEAYALAKIAGLKLCEYYRRQYGLLYHSAMPTNLYGPGDNYHPENSHVLPALLRRFHEAKLSDADEVVIWGSGTPRREFLHVDDLAEALVFLLQQEDPPDWVNVGTGEDLSIRELAEMIADVVGYRGSVSTDPTRADGTPRKVTDMSLLHSLGWRHRIELREGLERTYEEFQRETGGGKLRVF